MKTVTITDTIGFFYADQGGGLYLDEVLPRDGWSGHRRSHAMSCDDIVGGEVFIQCGETKTYGRIRITVEWEPLEAQEEKP